MPKELEKKLRERGRKMGLKGKELDAYVYGGLRRMGWRPGRGKRGKVRN